MTAAEPNLEGNDDVQKAKINIQACGDDLKGLAGKASEQSSRFKQFVTKAWREVAETSEREAS